MIKLIDVHKSFGKQHVLRGVHLDIEDGKTTVIIGKSGGGKSVLLKHIIGLLKPDDGQILIDGKDVTKMDEKELKELLGHTPVEVFAGALLGIVISLLLYK